MSRGRSQRKQDSRHGAELDLFGRRDPFQEMHQVMRNFGGFGGDDFFGGSLMRPMGNPFEDMMDFSSAHRNLQGAGNGGTFISHSYVSSSTVGKDGKVKHQTFVENSSGQNKNGQTISETKQAYKNNEGIKRLAQERMLNDKGHKIIKQKRGEQPEQVIQHYYNLEDHDAGQFRHDWQSANHDMKFLENRDKYIQAITNPTQHNGHHQQRQLGFDPRREERREEPRREERREQPRREEPKRVEHVVREPVREPMREPVRRAEDPRVHYDSRQQGSRKVQTPSQYGSSQKSGGNSFKPKTYI